MIILFLIILTPILYCFITFTICSVNELNGVNRKFVFPIKSLLYESALQYFVFLFLLIDSMRKWKNNKVNSNKYALLLPGYSETQFIFLKLKKILETNVINYKILKYKPFLGDLYLQSEYLRKEVDLIVSTDENAEIFIIGHSMGGLIGRYFVENYDSDNIKMLILIATPHKGTLFGKFALGKCAKQLLPENPFLNNLMTKSRKKVLNIYSEADNLICPRHSAIYNDFNISLDDMPLHNSTLFNRQTLKIIKEQITNGNY